MKTTHNFQSEIYPLTKKPRIQIENQVFGQLTAIKPVGRIFIKKNTRVSRVVWECSCTCGNKHLATASQLIRKKCTRCVNCTKNVRKIAGTKKLLEYNNSREHLGTAQYSFNRLLSRYKSGAATRNLQFNLTEHEFRVLTSSNCHYCGIAPLKEANFYNYIKDDGQAYYKYNGVDRKDNKLGYTSENCVPCCSDCNFLKAGRDYDYFISLIKTIFNNIIKY